MPTRKRWIQTDDKKKNHSDRNDPHKRAPLIYYRHIMCPSMMWKILMAPLRESISYSLISDGHEKEKGCLKGIRGK